MEERMTKTGNTAISVGYEKKNYKNESFHFAMSNVTFILEFSGLNPLLRQDWSAVCLLSSLLPGELRYLY